MQFNKVVLITGCSSGIGFITALTFARHKYTVFASVRNLKSDGVKELIEITSKEKLDLHVIEIDVIHEKNVIQGVTQIIKVAKKIDVLVNNAGFGALGPVEAFTDQEIKNQFETNVFGTIRMIKAVAPIMRQQGSGTIINIGSINGLIAFPLYGMYASSKFAIEALTESLRFELRQFGIKVALVEPGTFITDFSKNRKLPESLQNDLSPYKKTVKVFFDKLDVKAKKLHIGFISKLVDSKRVADKIYKIAESNNPKLHNRVGIDSHVYYFGKKILPNYFWQFILQKVYK